MATIEERAYDSRRMHFDESFQTFNKEHRNMREWEYGYCQGATEQREIDIEKACEWLRTWLINNDEMAIGHAYLAESIVEEFRKAMEE